jgi:hypothetical protein
MTDLISVVVWMAVFSLVLAFTVFVVSKIVEHRNPPIGKFLAIDGIGLHTSSAAAVRQLFTCTAMPRSSRISA